MLDVVAVKPSNEAVSTPAANAPFTTGDSLDAPLVVPIVLGTQVKVSNYPRCATLKANIGSKSALANGGNVHLNNHLCPPLDLTCLRKLLATLSKVGSKLCTSIVSGAGLLGNVPLMFLMALVCRVC